MFLGLLNGRKEILGYDPKARARTSMQIFDRSNPGCGNIFFISMDGVSGLEAGAKAIFPKVVVQRCIVHLIRNSIKYVPTKDYKKFTQSLKKVYGAPNLKAANASFETFCKEWNQYPGGHRSMEEKLCPCRAAV